MRHNSQLSILLCLFLLDQYAAASWWYLGLVSSQAMSAQQVAQRNADPRSRCSYDILSPRQQQMCRDHLNVLDIVRKGASLGIEECQFQFKNQRWNCTTFNSTNVFGKVVQFRSRETAYIYAISSAGVMWSMTKSCSKGEIPSLCGCAKQQNTQQQASSQSDFQWGGCSDNTKYGERFARDFVDSREPVEDSNKQQLAHALMNLWNNEAGRRSVKNSLRRVCKCHGVSGSCTNQICWHQLPDFKSISVDLKRRLDGAVKMRLRNTKLRPASAKVKRATKGDLVFLEESPDYCRPDTQYGIIGTSGRECNRTSSGSDGCAVLCCGRGFHARMTEYREECECKFVWCCNVQCKICNRQVVKHYCN